MPWRFPSSPAGELQVVTLRRHPAVLAGSTVMAVGSLAVAAVFTIATSLRHDSSRLEFLWVVFAVFLIRFAWKTVCWFSEYLLITSSRVQQSYGILWQKCESVSLAKVTDVRLRRSILGRFLGYGYLTCESPALNGRLFRVDFCPYPEQIFLELFGLMFPDTSEIPWGGPIRDASFSELSREQKGG